MATFNYQTTTRSILADLYTPVGVYMRLRDLYPQSALMESSDYHDSNNSRSFIGINPIASIAISHGNVICTFPDNSSTTAPVTKDYRCEHAIREFLDYFQVSGDIDVECEGVGVKPFTLYEYIF